MRTAAPLVRPKTTPFNWIWLSILQPCGSTRAPAGCSGNDRRRRDAVAVRIELAADGSTFVFGGVPGQRSRIEDAVAVGIDGRGGVLRTGRRGRRPRPAEGELQAEAREIVDARLPPPLIS